MDTNFNKDVVLHGFNNLTKTLSFNMYDICYAKNSKDRDAYISYINEQYNAERLTEILKEVTKIIGASVLNIAKQDYEPQGASVTLLVCEESDMKAVTGDNNKSEVAVKPEAITNPEAVVKPQVAIPISDVVAAKPEAVVAKPEVVVPISDVVVAKPEVVVAHLDKSHITVHTYPEYHPVDGVATFRADIDVSTCGRISPLNALSYLIKSFDSDIMTIDYRVRGFTRDMTGRKLFIDHDINSIQNYVPDEDKRRYQFIDVNVYQENIFHTKCKLKEFDINNYLFGVKKADIDEYEVIEIEQKLRKEMDEIFYGRNLY